MDISKFLNYIEAKTLNNHMEYTKKFTITSFYYYIFKIHLNMEASLVI